MTTKSKKTSAATKGRTPRSCAATPGSAGWIAVEDRMPKTRHKVIVCGHWDDPKNRWRTIARWYPAGTLDATEWDEPPDEWWSEDGETCKNPKGLWVEEPVEGDETYFLQNVTHWMPLPAWPNTKGQP